jgi:UDP-2,3-diacylglucosamine hydrolase
LQRWESRQVLGIIRFKNKITHEHLLKGKVSKLPLPYYFFSDVHFSTELTNNELEKRKKVFTILDHLKQSGGSLFILGDFFDFWWDQGSYIPSQLKDVYNYLSDLRKAKVPIHLIGGNHDFWLYKFLCPSLGIIFYDDHMDFHSDGLRFYLTHGDGLLKNDTGYRWMKRVLRCPLAIWGLDRFHIEGIYRTARLISHTSRKHSNEKWSDLKAMADEMLDYLQMKNHQGYHIAMMGHVHYPSVRKDNSKIAIVLGDWMTHQHYAVWDGKTLSHVKWDESSE